MNNLIKIAGVTLIALSLAACSTTARNAPQGFNLPPRAQIIPDPEPQPRIPTNASVNEIALEYGAAFGRANQRLVDGGINYQNLANSLAENR